MCRFLLLHTDGPFDPAPLFAAFAGACHYSRPLDEGGQRDGWGITWLGADDTWSLHKRLAPIWEDADWLAHPPRSRAYALHARSASFERDRRNIEYNQPYLYPGDVARAPGVRQAHPYAFAFNGLLRGVRLPRPVDGRIGAQRVWSLLRAHTRELVACNIGLIDTQHVYASCEYSHAPEYYQLRFHHGSGLRAVCSEPLPGYDFRDVPPGQVLTL